MGTDRINFDFRQGFWHCPIKKSINKSGQYDLDEIKTRCVNSRKWYLKLSYRVWLSRRVDSAGPGSVQHFHKWLGNKLTNILHIIYGWNMRVWKHFEQQERKIIILENLRCFVSLCWNSVISVKCLRVRVKYTNTKWDKNPRYLFWRTLSECLSGPQTLPAKKMMVLIYKHQMLFWLY